jgi:multidrug transporter EmrE-like cation transporter
MIGVYVALNSAGAIAIKQAVQRTGRSDPTSVTATLEFFSDVI